MLQHNILQDFGCPWVLILKCLAELATEFSPGKSEKFSSRMVSIGSPESSRGFVLAMVATPSVLPCDSIVSVVKERSALRLAKAGPDSSHWGDLDQKRVGGGRGVALESWKNPRRGVPSDARGGPALGGSGRPIYCPAQLLSRPFRSEIRALAGKTSGWRDGTGSFLPHRCGKKFAGDRESPLFLRLRDRPPRGAHLRRGGLPDRARHTLQSAVPLRRKAAAATQRRGRVVSPALPSAPFCGPPAPRRGTGSAGGCSTTAAEVLLLSREQEAADRTVTTSCSDGSIGSVSGRAPQKIGKRKPRRKKG
ncbi:hypothetical protein E2320_007273 [Naja naja]|nr:hypothetical protein E2320_007273 [Naja naja]